MLVKRNMDYSCMRLKINLWSEALTYQLSVWDVLLKTDLYK